MSQHSSPLLIPEAANGESSALEQVDMSAAVKGGGYDERFIQDLVLAHPESLPIDEIDRSFLGAIAVCRELSLPSGFVDALFINRDGLLTLVECKLWRNPQARREVIGQILDYAKDLGRFQYSDLQRQVSMRLGQSGNVLFGLVQKRHPDLDEASFVDAVSRSLQTGRFLLLIVGDGIREGVEAIAEYVQEHSGLHFTLGLVEMPVYRVPGGGTLVLPRILARTAVLNRTVVELRSDNMAVVDDERNDVGAQLADSAESAAAVFYREFWGELLAGFLLDAADQPIPKPARIGNLNFRLPVPGGQLVWVSAYRYAKGNTVGVFVSCRRNTVGAEVLKRVLESREDLDPLLGEETEWVESEGREGLWPIHNYRYTSLEDPEDRERTLEWLRARINLFVNVFRPRVKAIADEMDL